ncbi:MAG TPA: serine/threonine-protein kinase [Polyangia bacterium]|nr:serine/threonine-protein kinase [Polyangia bacterium]
MPDSARGPSDAGSLRSLLEAVAEAPAAINERLGAGMMVGRYRLVEAIGRGGFGVVFKAVDTELGREIALKLLSSHRRSADAETRLMREAQAMARLSHPNVITIYDVGVFEAGVFIAMELVDGGTLSRWMKQPRPWLKTVETFLGAGRGLAAAHRAGLVHRDFKPDNVLVGRDGRVCVTDFGVARMMNAADDSGARAPADSALVVSLTRTGMLLGTPAYMAPEQMNGEASDARADVFSFCVALFEALYRERPFSGADVQTLKQAIAERRVLAPSGSDVPARLRRVLVRGLSAAPGERHQSMEELLADLEAVARADRRRRFFGASAAGAGLVVALAAGGWSWLRPSHAPAPPPPIAPAPTPIAPAPTVIAPRAPATGTLDVRVNTDAARIELDGEVVAEAARSARITVEAAREHQLRVSAPGFRPLERKLRVGPNATVETAVSLARVEKPAPRPSPAPEDPNGAIDPYRQNGQPLHEKHAAPVTE